MTQSVIVDTDILIDFGLEKTDAVQTWSIYNCLFRSQSSHIGAVKHQQTNL